MSEATLDAAGERPRDSVGLARLELGLVRIRWFAVVFGLFQIWQDSTHPPTPPAYVLPLAYSLLGLLAAGNVVVWLLARRASRTTLPRLGLAAFAMDVLVVLGMTWIYTYEETGTVWIVLYVLPLEGAIRYQFRGAVATIWVALASELGRELHRTAILPHLQYRIDEVTFRVGILAIVALVAGFMARSLAEQAAAADRRARAFEELARREHAARRELSAFHATVLAGIAGHEPSTALQAMADAIGKYLTYESLAIMLVEDSGLWCRGSHGPDAEPRNTRVPPGSGIAARAVEEGAPILVEDVPLVERRTPESAPGSEMAAPMVIGGHVIGVIHVQSSVAGSFAQADLEVLTRLADQVALVAFHVQLHAERAETVARLRELAEMKSDFVAITSHELRTPLTGIRGFASLLLKNFDKLSRDEAREFLAVVDEQSQRLSRLVEDLLIVSRLDAGRLRLEEREVELRPMLEGLVASFVDAADRISLETPVEQARGRFDPDRVEQILRNLLDNALKFSALPVTLTARTTPNSVIFEVTDRGVGIPSNEVAKIFDRFYQAGDGTQREGEGVGLGLYITKRLIDEMGGEIAVDSLPGRGTTFRIRIPQPGSRHAAARRAATAG